MKDFSFSIESLVHADRETVWKHVTQMKNVNAELMPFARMSYPEDRSELGDQQIPMNETLFKSTIFLFGFIPADVHYLKLDKLDPGHAFYENSASFVNKYWKHTRTLTEQDGNTLVRDEVHFLPKISFFGHIYLPLIKKIFDNRHKHLREAFAK